MLPHNPVRSAEPERGIASVGGAQATGGNAQTPAGPQRLGLKWRVTRLATDTDKVMWCITKFLRASDGLLDLVIYCSPPGFPLWFVERDGAQEKANELNNVIRGRKA